MTRIFLALLFFAAISIPAFGQQMTKFSDDPSEFIKELTSMLEATKREDCQALAKEITQSHKGGNLNSLIPEMQKMGNLMLDRKMTVYPYFLKYMQAVTGFQRSGRAASFFTNWNSILHEITAQQKRGNNTQFNSFMDFSLSFIEGGAIYSSQAKSWVPGSTNFTLAMKDGVPVATFPQMNLTGYTRGDTLVIYNTEGSYYPLENKWAGKSGKIDWSRAGMNKDDVYAEFKQYELNLEKAALEIDSVTFYFKSLFSKPLTGSLTDKLLSLQVEERATYPKFESYTIDLNIDKLTDNISYSGGFALHGNKIFGKGTPEKPCELRFKLANGKTAMVSRSQRVLIKKPDDISADNAEVSVYVDKDSIYHPGLNLVYRIPKNEITLLRGTSGVSKTSFFSSYHNQEITADVITWKLDEPFMTIKMITGAGKAPALFTSMNFFRKEELRKYEQVTDYNLVTQLKKYVDKHKTRDFYAENFAKFINPRYDEGTIKRELFRLVEDGYIYYYEDRGLIWVKPKVFNHVQANMNLIDYDIIRVQSFATQPNGKFNIESKDIDLIGVDQILMSDSQNVVLFPDTGRISIQKNRDMQFSGKVIAGRIDFIGDGFKFEYDSFRLDLTDLAAAIIYLESENRDAQGNPMFIPIKSMIEGLTGELAIDKPNNKSGKARFPEYPIFTNRDLSYVYYQRKSIYDSAYIKERFFFELDPFEFDSLDTFNPYNTNLTGRLNSADIFPIFPQRLYIQDDLSLGFKRVTPVEGFPLYRGMATYKDSVSLSNKGLLGRGKIDYLFTKTESDKIVFLPDSMLAKAELFTMKETNHQGVKFPKLTGYNTNIRWLPYLDTMNLKSNLDPFIMYDIEAKMNGELTFITKSGLYGDGKFEFKEAALTSNQFRFQSDELDADTMSLEILAIDQDKVTFNTPNVKGHIDFQKRIGEFKSNLEGISTEFANNQYKTNIDQFTWDMDAGLLDFKSPPGKKAWFVSFHPDQDSLKFLGTQAFFDMKSSILKVEGVPEIIVADSRIIPDSNKVVIREAAAMDQLKNAVVKTDTTKEFHQIYAATLDVKSRNNFSGKGIMDYLSRDNSKQQITMDEIAVRDSTHRKKKFYMTYAKGDIKKEQGFTLDPKVSFYGTPSLKSTKELLEFSGYGRLKLDNKLIATDWFSFKDDINPKDFTIHYEVPLNESKDTLHVGIFVGESDSVNMYTSMMGKKKSPSDKEIFSAKGIVKYDSRQKEFKLGDKEKILNGALHGNTLTYNETREVITTEGRFSLGLDFFPLKTTAAGQIEHNLKENQYTFKSVVGIALKIDKNLMETFSADIRNYSAGQTDIDYTKPVFLNSIIDLSEEKKSEKLVQEINSTGGFVKPKALKDFNIILSDLNLIYEPKYRIFRSEGPIGVSIVGDKGVHRKMKGWVEFGKRRTGDFFSLYFESSTNDWYFITYRNMTLQILSSNEDFNKALGAIAPEKRASKVPGTAQFYFYSISGFGDKDIFLNRMTRLAAGEEIEVVDYEDPLDYEIFRPNMDFDFFDMDDEDVVVPQKGKKGKGKDYPAGPIEDMMRQQPVVDESEIMEEDDLPSKKKKKGGKEADDPIMQMLESEKEKNQGKQEAPEEEVPYQEELGEEEELDLKPKKDKKKKGKEEELDPIQRMLQNPE